LREAPAERPRGRAVSWLDPVRSALDLAPRPCPIFFRDDDAGWEDARLYALLDRFDAHGIPVDVAVIPTELRATLARELTIRTTFSGVRLHQHGFAHRNHQQVGRRCEFGSDRDRAAQANDIAAGRAILLDTFAALLDPVFTPPWNRCSAVTGDVLVAQGVRVLSRDATAVPLRRAALWEVPVTVDWFGHRKDLRWTREELAELMAERIGDGGPVGIMLHHAVTDEAERRAVDELLALIARNPHVAQSTIMGLVPDPRTPHGAS
jgi:predicted deacetylase